MNKSYTHIKVLAVGFMVSLFLLLVGVVQAAPPDDVTNPGDPIVGTSANYPAAESPDKIIDDNTGTKYLNFDKLNTGFIVTPAVGATRITGITITSANDAQERDPASYAVYGGSSAAGPFSLIAAGSVPPFTGRQVKQSFPFAQPASAIYTSYKVIFPNVNRAGAANSMQASEVELPGTVESADTWAPYATRATAPNLTTIKIEFSEPVVIGGATFEVSGGLTVADAQLDPANSSIVNLTVSTMIPGNNYTVTINGLTDAASNAAGTLTPVAFASTGVSAMGYSVDFGGRDGSSNTKFVGPNDEVGYVVRKNWNGINNGNGGIGNDTTTGFLNDGNGQPSTVTFRFQANDNWNNDGVLTTPTETMMYGVIKQNTRGSSDTFTFQNVPAGKYDLITYHAVNCDNAWVDLTAGSTTYYFVEQHRFTAPWTQALNSTDPNTRTRANFAIINNLSPVNGNIVFTMKWPTSGGDGDGNGMAGCQLIPAPGLKQIAGNGLSQIKLQFLEPLADTVADAANFIVSGDVVVTGVALSADYKTLLLDTTAMVKGNTYWVTMNNIVSRDDATIALPANAMAKFVAVAPTDISVNFSGANTATTPARLGAGDVAGVDPRANWNNLDANVYRNDFLNADKTMYAGFPVKDSDGMPSPVTVTFVADEKWGSETTAAGPNGAGDAVLMNGYLGPSSGDWPRDVSFDNVPFGLYKVIVYTLRDGSGEGEQISLNGGTPFEVRSEGKGDWDGSPAYRRGSSTDPAARDLCNYVQFDDVNPVDNTFKITFQAKTFRAPCNGIQVISTELVPVQFTLEPVDTTVAENDYFTLSCAVVGSGQKTVQWYMNDIAIAGANGFSYTAKATADMDQAVFRVDVGNGWSLATSTNATLTVLQDVTPPRLVTFAGGPPTDDKVGLVFSEPITVESAQNTANYVFAGGPAAVEQAALEPDGKTVILTLNPPLQGGLDYTLTISEIYDLAQIPNPIDPNPTVVNFHTMKLICTNGTIEKKMWWNQSGGGVDTLLSDARYPNKPDVLEYPSSFDLAYGTDEHKNDGGRLAGIIYPPVTGFYQFVDWSDDSSRVWLSTDANPANKRQIIYQSGCCANIWSERIYLVGGVGYYLEAAYGNGAGGDALHVYWQKPGDTTFGAISGANVGICVTNDLINPVVTSVSAGPVPYVAYVNFSKSMSSAVSFNPADPNFVYATVTNETQVLNVTNVAFLYDNKAIALFLDGNVGPGEVFTVTIGGPGAVDTTFNNNPLVPNPSSGQITGVAIQTGNPVLREIWYGHSGTEFQFDTGAAYGNTLALLTNLSRYPCSPDMQDFVNVFDITNPDNLYDAVHSGGRLRTWIVPALSGNYQFHQKSDDAGLVWLSAGANPAEMQPIIYQSGCCADLYSAVIPLQAGVAYYMEAIYENGTGGDYLHVDWKIPGASAYTAIPAAQMAYAINPNAVTITINTQPVEATVEECRPAIFTVDATVSCGGGAAAYQWFKAGSAVTGATGKTLTYVPTLADDGASIFCRISVPGKSVDTATVALHVTPDGDIPTPISVKGDATLSRVHIVFSENVETASASDPAAYAVTDSSGGYLGANFGYPTTVSVNGNTVVLTFEGAQMAQGELYTVTFGSIWDMCHANPVEYGSSVSFHAWKLMPYTATFDLYKNLNGTTIADLTGAAKFPNNPDETYYIGNFDSRQAYIADLDNDPTHNNYGGRITAWFKAPVTGNYKFYEQNDDDMQLFVSTDADPANKASVLTRPCCFSWYAETNATADIPMVAGQLYYMEGLYKEGGGGDYLRIAVRIPGDTTDANSLMPIGPQYLWTMIDPDSIQTLPTAGMLPAGSLTVRGFNNHIVQVTNVFTNDTIALAESVLAGTYPDQGINLALVPFFAEPGVINYNVETAQYGRILPDAAFRGIPGASNTTDNFVMESTTFVHLTPGLHCFAVNSDDNFRLFGAGVQVGEYNFVTGRGSADTVMRFYAPEEGLYPFRLVYIQGTGGGNVEWWMADAVAETVTAINGTDAIQAFRPIDQNPPVITCPQDMAVECGVPVNFAVSAVDPEDGPVAVTCVPTNGSKFAVGPTTVNCSATDAFGNGAQCSFVVTATDTVGPIMSCPANTVIAECAGPNGRTVDFTVSALDACDGPVPVTCVPASGSVFPLGNTVVICTATDATQNSTQCQFTVNVSEGDTQAPVIACPTQPVIAECVGSTGTPVTYPTPAATDNCDPAVTVTCSPASGSTFPLGDTTVTCEAFDSRNNRGSCTFIVRVVDTVAPEILDATNRVVCGTGPTVVTFDYIWAMDLCGVTTVSCTPASGSEFPVGETTVNCQANDGNGNVANKSFAVTVRGTQPTLHITTTDQAITLTWTKSDCYKLHFRTDLGTAASASTLVWDVYTDPITDDGTTCTAVITKPTTGNKYFLLK